MKLVSRDRPVLIGSKDNELIAGIQGDRRELPPIEYSCIISQMPPGKVDRRSGNITQLNPIRMITVLVSQPLSV